MADEPIEDLSREPILRAARRVSYLGRTCPSVGGLVLLRTLGRGAMGAVYLAVHPVLGSRRAVKFLLPSHQERHGEKAVKRFMREAKLGFDLKSPHLVPVLDVNEDPDTGFHFMVMEYVDGVAASAFLKGTPGRLPEGAALDLALSMAEGMAAAHREGVIHRDLKPANVLVPRDEAGGFRFDGAQVADLGIARLEEDEAQLTHSMMGVGTPGYMAPEQWDDAKHAGKPADVFALGATLYALLAGQAPFDRGGDQRSCRTATLAGEYTPLPELVPGVSPVTALVVERCLRVAPEGRFADAPALLLALREARAALGADAIAERHALEAATVAAARPETGRPVSTPTPTPDLGGGDSPGGAFGGRNPRSPEAEGVAPGYGESNPTKAADGRPVPPEPPPTQRVGTPAVHQPTEVASPKGKSRAPAPAIALALMAVLVGIGAWSTRESWMPKGRMHEGPSWSGDVASGDTNAGSPRPRATSGDGNSDAEDDDFARFMRDGPAAPRGGHLDGDDSGAGPGSGGSPTDLVNRVPIRYVFPAAVPGLPPPPDDVLTRHLALTKLPAGIFRDDTGRLYAEKDGAELVLVPEGEFQMGSDSGQANEKPVLRVHLSAYLMDRKRPTRPSPRSPHISGAGLAAWARVCAVSWAGRRPRRAG